MQIRVPILQTSFPWALRSTWILLYPYSCRDHTQRAGREPKYEKNPAQFLKYISHFLSGLFLTSLFLLEEEQPELILTHHSIWRSFFYHSPNSPFQKDVTEQNYFNRKRKFTLLFNRKQTNKQTQTIRRVPD